MRTLSLRTFLAASTSVVLLITVIASGTIVALTTVLRSTTDDVAIALESVQLAEDIEVSLLTHNSLSAQMLVSPAPELREHWERLDRALQDKLAAMRRLIVDETEARVMDDVESTVWAYIHARRSADARRVPLSRALVEVSDELDAAVTAMEELVNVNVEQARTAVSRARYWDDLANVGGIGLAATMLICLAVASRWIHRRAIRPLLGIGEVIRVYGQGSRSARCAVTGPAEIRETARTFNAMADTLDRQRRGRLAFLAGVAHDLRNPLTVLKTSAALMNLTAKGGGNAEQRRYADLVDRQATHLDRMVGDLLDSTRIEAGELELKLSTCDLRQLARDTLELWRPLSTGHDLTLSVPEETVAVTCDPVRMEQVMSNLVSNALKYSPPGTEVKVAVRVDAADVVIEVSDQGVGIAAEDLPHVFEPFRRHGTLRDAVPGVGLGLSVVHRIVEGHHGHIEVDSAPGAGSTFRVILALAA